MDCVIKGREYSQCYMAMGEEVVLRYFHILPFFRLDNQFQRLLCHTYCVGTETKCLSLLFHTFLV